MRTTYTRALILSAVLVLALSGAHAAKAPEVVTLDSASPLLEIRVMVRAGSANDPDGISTANSFKAYSSFQQGGQNSLALLQVDPADGFGASRVNF